MLNGSYFNELELEVFDDKYYDADKVDEILVDIRAQAADMVREIMSLREKVAEYDRKKGEISSAVAEAKKTCNEIISRANKEADQIKARAAASSAPSGRGDEFYIRKVEKFYEGVREQYEKSVSDLNAQWQAFLVSVSEPDAHDLRIRIADIANTIDEIEKSTH